MIKFVIKLSIFLVLAFFADEAVGTLSMALFNRSKTDTLGKENYIKNSISDDIIVMGSSRAECHYVSNLMSESLNKKVYNAGFSGTGIVLSYGLLLEILRNHKPETIIYEITPQFDWLKGDNDRFLSYLKYSYDIPGIDSIFWSVDPYYKIKMESQSFRSNSTLQSLIKSSLLATKDTCNGYRPLHGHLNVKIQNGKLNEPTLEIDSLKLRYMNLFITLCNDNNIDLIFAVSPELEYDKNFYDYGREIANLNNIKLIDACDLSLFKDKSLFKDAVHLNDYGARIYTKWVVNQLRKE